MERVRALTDGDRIALAEARKALDESYREPSLKAVAELIVGRGEQYAVARGELAGAHLPESLDDDPARRDEVARLVQLAIDEMLVALVAQDILHPKHLRELYRPWEAMSGQV